MKNNFKSFIKKIFLPVGSVLGMFFILVCICLFGVMSPIAEDTGFSVLPGASVSSVAAQLRSDDMIISQDLFKIVVRFYGGNIQSGQYDIRKNASIWRIARAFTKGHIASTTIIIHEGLTLKQIKVLLLEHDTLSGDVECAKDALSSQGKKDPVCLLTDGDLFPDTYRVAKGTARLDVLRLSRGKMDSIRLGWENSGRPMPSPLKTWNEVVTLASIVQKETPMVSEMPVVASVYINRLKKKMKLQADPTVVYAITDGLGNMQGAGLFTGHLKANSPYNTYTNHGLPPTPIANVGRRAIAAVLDPADTTYLFFVADGTGGHKFAHSYSEHQKNHADWREIKKALNAKKSQKNEPKID